MECAESDGGDSGGDGNGGGGNLLVAASLLAAAVAGEAVPAGAGLADRGPQQLARTSRYDAGRFLDR